ncbi:hypothetical protein HQ545_06325 [Candidatus Woesearchaeota archaeon]|nr:hypothetical protein [Candidatus Woesearchaeota archaeon]
MKDLYIDTLVNDVLRRNRMRKVRNAATCVLLGAAVCLAYDCAGVTEYVMSYLK